MNKFIFSLAALAALSTASFASSPVAGDSRFPHDLNRDEMGFPQPNASEHAIAIPGTSDGWLFGHGENVKDPMEVRRFDEKNK